MNHKELAVHTVLPRARWYPIWRDICAVMYSVVLSLFSGSIFSSLESIAINLSTLYPLSHIENPQNFATKGICCHNLQKQERSVNYAKLVINQKVDGKQILNIFKRISRTQSKLWSKGGKGKYIKRRYRYLRVGVGLGLQQVSTGQLTSPLIANCQLSKDLSSY